MPEGRAEKEELRRNILLRLKKIEGQVRGIQDMVSQNKGCEDVLAQVRAVQSALKAVSGLMLKNYLLICATELGDESTPQDVFQQLDKTLALLTRFVEH